MKLLGRFAREAIAAAVGAATLWLLQNPPGADGYVLDLVSWLGAIDSAWAVGAAGSAVMLLAVGVTIALIRALSSEGRTYWEVELALPSIVTILVGAAAACLLVASGLAMCAGGSTWGLVPLLLAGWIGARLAARLRQAWIRFAY